MLPRTLIAAAGVVIAVATLAPIQTTFGHALGIQPQPRSETVLLVGDIAPPDVTHIVTRPGLYGLSNPPAGNVYAVVSDQLVRLDADTGQILSRLRMVEAVID